MKYARCRNMSVVPSICLPLCWIQYFLFFYKRFNNALIYMLILISLKWLIDMFLMKMEVVTVNGIWHGCIEIYSEFCLNILLHKISTPAGIKTEKCNQNFFYNFCLQFSYFNMTSIVPNKYFLGFIPDLRMLDIYISMYRMYV